MLKNFSNILEIYFIVSGIFQFTGMFVFNFAQHYATQAQHAKINFICHDLWKVIVRFQFLKRLLKTYTSFRLKL